MEENSASKVIGNILGVIIAVIILLPLVLAASAYIGYFIGILVMWLAGGVLTDLLGINANDIPAVMAWLFVIGAILGGLSGGVRNE